MNTLLTNRTAPLVSFEGETNGKPSETIPNQAISAMELLRRHATGQPLGFKNVEPVYDDPKQETIPEFYKMSKLDRLHALQDNSERVKDLSDEVKHYQKAEAQKAEALKQQQKQENGKTESTTTSEPVSEKE